MKEYNHESYEKYKALVTEILPDILQYFNWENKSINDSEIKHYMNRASSGERIFCQFLLYIWFGGNKYEFSLAHLLSILSGRRKRLVLTWMAEPYWP